MMQEDGTHGGFEENQILNAFELRLIIQAMREEQTGGRELSEAVKARILSCLRMTIHNGRNAAVANLATVTLGKLARGELAVPKASSKDAVARAVAKANSELAYHARR